MESAGVDDGAKMLGVGLGPSAKAASQTESTGSRHRKKYLKHFANIDPDFLHRATTGDLPNKMKDKAEDSTMHQKR
jgi:hypothetical protein